MTLDRLLEEKEVIVCCGSGGVGKTTVSAALGLRGAALGRKVLVCTIDPARRLANSLGIARLGGKEKRIADEHLGEPIKEGGSLWAMMLDTKRTWDLLIERYAPSPEVRDRILRNNFYQQMSGQVIGSQEYMAMEKLHELHRDGDYDLIVLDTPPTRHALDFLRAPNRLQDLLEGGVMKWLTAPGRVGLRAFRRGTSAIFDLLDRMLGLQFLRDLAEFFSAFESLFEGFRQRSRQVEELLRSPAAAFFLVTSPAPWTLAEAEVFRRRLADGGIALEAVIVNRVHTDYGVNGELAPESLERLPASLRQLVERLAGALEEHQGLARGDARRLDELRARIGSEVALHTVSAFATDVHDVDGLQRINAQLFG